MMNLLIAAMAMAPAQWDAWDIRAPYKVDSALQYEVVIDIDSGGQQIRVDMLMDHKTSKKSEAGFEGTFGWKALHVDGAPQPDETFDVTIKPNGVIKSVKSDYGDGMRRMFLPFFLNYPDRKVDVGDAWTYKDASEDEKDGHRATIENKVLEIGTVKEKKALKIQSKLSEEGPSPMKAEGTFWVAEDGTVLEYEFKVTGWLVPIADGQVFDATIKGAIRA